MSGYAFRSIAVFLMPKIFERGVSNEQHIIAKTAVHTFIFSQSVSKQNVKMKHTADNCVLYLSGGEAETDFHTAKLFRHHCGV